MKNFLWVLQLLVWASFPVCGALGVQVLAPIIYILPITLLIFRNLGIAVSESFRH